MPLSRRSFLATTALAAAAPAFPQSAPQPSGPIRLGLAGYSFRNLTRAELIAAMAQLHVTGLNAKDVKDHLPAEPSAEAEALAAYKSAGITLHAVGTVYFPKPDDADIRSKFEYAKRAGVPVIVAGDPAPETLPHLERFVKEYDIRIAIHNHGPEDKLYPSPLDVLKAVGNMDPRMGCCIDVGHTARSGTDVVAAIRAAGPRLHNIHMKDLADFGSKESQVAVGEGKMPVRAIFEALSAIRYPGWVDLEYEIHPENPIPGALASFSYMRGVLAGMSA